MNNFAARGWRRAWLLTPVLLYNTITRNSDLWLQANLVIIPNFVRTEPHAWTRKRVATNACVLKASTDVGARVRLVCFFFWFWRYRLWNWKVRMAIYVVHMLELFFFFVCETTRFMTLIPADQFSGIKPGLFKPVPYTVFWPYDSIMSRKHWFPINLNSLPLDISVSIGMNKKQRQDIDCPHTWS